MTRLVSRCELLLQSLEQFNRPADLCPLLLG